MTTALTKFLSGAACDSLGRSFRDILEQDDLWLECTHDWVQWCFPLFEKSQSVKNSPVLESPGEVRAIRESPAVQENMRSGLIRYAEFLRDTDHWLRYHDHNHLRITRIITSVKTLMSDQQACDFYRYVMDHVEARGNDKPSSVSMHYWKRAVNAERSPLSVL